MAERSSGPPVDPVEHPRGLCPLLARNERGRSLQERAVELLDERRVQVRVRGEAAGFGPLRGDDLQVAARQIRAQELACGSVDRKPVLPRLQAVAGRDGPGRARPRVAERERRRGVVLDIAVAETEV